MNVFASGQAAFLRNWDYAYADSQAPGSSTIGKVGVAPLPTFAGQSSPGTPLSAAGTCTSTRTARTSPPT